VQLRESVTRGGQEDYEDVGAVERVRGTTQE
jgi:hypothetical protein